jgi:hypothetical protein
LGDADGTEVVVDGLAHAANLCAEERPDGVAQPCPGHLV